MIKWVLFACNHLPFPFFQDYIILDEGHKIKNTATKTAKNLRLIPAKQHFILTGTPVQNNLRVSRYIWNSKYFGKSFQYDYCFCFFFCDSRTQKRDKESNRTQENSARDTNVTDNQTEYRENSARGTNVTNNQTEHRENIARDTNVTDNQTEHRGNIARDTNVVTNS